MLYKQYALLKRIVRNEHGYSLAMVRWLLSDYQANIRFLLACGDLNKQQATWLTRKAIFYSFSFTARKNPVVYGKRNMIF